MTLASGRSLQMLGLGGLALGLALIAPAALGRAQMGDPPPASDPEAVSRGQQVFTTNCAACHGADGAGGRGGAPNLMASPILRADPTGREAFANVVHEGRPAGGMPPFPSLTMDQIGDMAAFLRGSKSSAVERNIAADIVVGDAAAGKRYFEGEGGCTQCHSLTGNLKGIGKKYAPVVLQGRILLPRANGAFPVFLINGQADGPYTLLGPNGQGGAVPVDPPRTVTVHMRSGDVSGTPVYISDFNVSLRTQDGVYRSFARKGGQPRITISEPSEPHARYLKTMSDKARQDLTAYLLGVS